MDKYLNELDLPLHEELDSGANMSITRVPGGWIYRTYNEQVGGHFQCSSVFVPEPPLTTLIEG